MDSKNIEDITFEHAVKYNCVEIVSVSKDKTNNPKKIIC